MVAVMIVDVDPEVTKLAEAKPTSFWEHGSSSKTLSLASALLHIAN